jgi:hypothetical protein
MVTSRPGRFALREFPWNSTISQRLKRNLQKRVTYRFDLFLLGDGTTTAGVTPSFTKQELAKWEIEPGGRWFSEILDDLSITTWN